MEYFGFRCFFVQCVLSDVYCSEEGFYTERRKCFSMTFLLAVVNRSGIPAELVGSSLLINILCTLGLGTAVNVEIHQ